jgi:hypothetical protein
VTGRRGAMKEYDLFEKLLLAEDENEFEKLLRREDLGLENEAVWRALGDMEINFSTVGNQQTEATCALVEKLINGIDAVLMAECLSRGINPEGPDAPRTMSEAVEEFFGIKDGRPPSRTHPEYIIYPTPNACTLASLLRTSGPKQNSWRPPHHPAPRTSPSDP